MAHKITAHFSLEEAGCRDGTPYPIQWRTRLVELAEAFEDIRSRCGFAIKINSAYRTPAYNASMGGARLSQHVEGRALDLRPVQSNSVRLGALLEACQDSRSAGFFRGLGIYPSFVHIDTRPGTRLASWSGSRSSNILQV